MALPQPVNESEASAELKELYGSIKTSCDLPYVPLMFRYLGNYPTFLERLWPTIVSNIEDPTFRNLLKTIQEDVVRATKNLITASPDMLQITDHLITDAQKTLITEEVKTYFATQLRLAFISVALRERTKGWAVGSKFLPDLRTDSSTPGSRQETRLHAELHEIVIAETASSLSMREDIREPFLKFIMFMHEEFISIITREEYVFTRVQFEKILTHHITNIPHPLFGSFNEVVTSIPDSRELAHVFYFISEKFPVSQTIAALMWGLSLGVLTHSKIAGKEE